MIVCVYGSADELPDWHWDTSSLSWVYDRRYINRDLPYSCDGNCPHPKCSEDIWKHLRDNMANRDIKELAALLEKMFGSPE